jgi:invasion protein IalB
MTPLLAVVALAAAGASQPAAAQTKKAAPAAPAKPAAQSAPANLPAPKQLGNFDSWAAVELVQSSNKICYMFARPATSEPKGLKRGDIMLTVTHRPASKRFDEVSFQAGYAFKQGAPVNVDIDGKKFDFFTRTDVDADAAWAKDDAADKAVVAAMKNGKTLKVRGTSQRNTATTDTVNLAGFAKAYAEIGKACGVK